MGRKTSVAGIAHKGDQILIMHRLPGGSVGSLWEFPGGKVDSGESPQQALAREWMEETGFIIEVGEKITQADFEHKGQAFELLAFDITLSDNEATPALNEHDDWMWATPDEISGLALVESDQAILKVLLLK